MSGVQILAVGPEDSELRLDRWFKRHFPGLGHGRLEKLLRTGQIRIDGKRASAGDRITTGQSIRVPPLEDWAGAPPSYVPVSKPRDSDLAALRAAVLYRDDDVIVLDKPAGLAVQGGTGTVHHLDGLLDALRFDAAERPRLVHRLDKDTSGILLLARSAAAAAALAAAFRSKTARKIYWAVVVGLPLPRQGKIDLPLAKLPGSGGEKMAPEDDGKSAVTYYSVIENAGDKASFVALLPVTGRTHQLRAHCLAPSPSARRSSATANMAERQRRSPARRASAISIFTPARSPCPTRAAACCKRRRRCRRTCGRPGASSAFPRRSPTPSPSSNSRR